MIIQTYLDCTVCAIELVDLAKESCWDNRETEVRWITMDSDDAQQETNSQTFARKAIEPVNEPSYEIVPGTTKCIQILFNATAAFSKYSCLVKEINFKDTLMFQVCSFHRLNNYELALTSHSQVLNHNYLDIIMDNN